jgi:hypothetical protein
VIVFCGEGSFRGELSRRNLHLENLPKFLYKIFLICFTFTLNFTCGDVLGELSRGNYKRGWNYLRKLFVGEIFLGKSPLPF